MAPISQHTHTFQRRWSNADGEKVGLWISLGIIITIILFTVLLGSLNIYLGKPLSKVREFEDEQAVRDNRAEALAQELEEVRNQLARKSEEYEAALREKEGVERNFDTQRQLVQQQNDRIANLTRAGDEKADELRQRTTELAESRLFGTERATETTNLRNNLRDVEAERIRLDRECDRLKMQLNFATEQIARHRRHCNLDDED
jgi:chromosome segregation ATPase